jgi:hypothetical protein
MRFVTRKRLSALEVFDVFDEPHVPAGRRVYPHGTEHRDLLARIGVQQLRHGGARQQ